MFFKYSILCYFISGKGNSLRYEVFGGIDHHLIFQNVKKLPSLDSEWIELQFYEAEIPFLKEQGEEENALNEGEEEVDEVYGIISEA